MTDLINIERKLDGIAEKMETLVRLEVQHSATVDRVARLERDVEKLDASQDRLRDEVKSNSFVTSTIERFAWVAISAAVGIAAYFVRIFGA